MGALWVVRARAGRQTAGHRDSSDRGGRGPRRRPGATDVRETQEFLAFEREWLTGAWTPGKTASALLVPLILGVLCLAFWKPSLVWGLVVINAIAVTKVAWGVVDGGGSGWAMLGPALVGLAICDAAVLYAIGRLRAGTRARRPGEPNPR